MTKHKTNNKLTMNTINQHNKPTIKSYINTHYSPLSSTSNPLQPRIFHTEGVILI